MEHRKEKNNFKAVPQFGGWDLKAGGATDYSMVFSRARANRKQQKAAVFNHVSLGDEQDFDATAAAAAAPAQVQDDSVVRKKRILTYINCCIRP